MYKLSLLLLVVFCSSCVRFPGRITLEGKFQNLETDEVCIFKKDGTAEYKIKAENKETCCSGSAHYNTDKPQQIYMSVISTNVGMFTLYLTDDPDKIKCIRGWDSSIVILKKYR